MLTDTPSGPRIYVLAPSLTYKQANCTSRTSADRELLCPCACVSPHKVMALCPPNPASRCLQARPSVRTSRCIDITCRAPAPAPERQDMYPHSPSLPQIPPAVAALEAELIPQKPTVLWANLPSHPSSQCSFPSPRGLCPIGP